MRGDWRPSPEEVAELVPVLKEARALVAEKSRDFASLAASNGIPLSPAEAEKSEREITSLVVQLDQL
jgi:hypothetical protein